MAISQYLLSILIWLPIVGGIVVLAIGNDDNVASGRSESMRIVSLAVTVLTFVISLGLYAGFDNSTSAMQFVERVSWIPALDVWYYLGIDGISAPLILLTTFITPLVVIAGWDTIKNRSAQYMAAFLILEGLMIGVFSALDGLLFLMVGVSAWLNGADAGFYVMLTGLAVIVFMITGWFAEVIGESHLRRPILAVTITSEANQARLPEIRAVQQQALDHPGPDHGRYPEIRHEGLIEMQLRAAP